MAILVENWMELVDNQWQYQIAAAAIFVYFAMSHARIVN